MVGFSARISRSASFSIVPRRVTLAICLASESSFKSNILLLLEVVGLEGVGMVAAVAVEWVVSLAAVAAGVDGEGMAVVAGT